MSTYNPFKNRASSAQGPALDFYPVTPSDSVNLPSVAIGLYIETAGTVVFETLGGALRTVEVPDFMILPCAVVRVNATGTSAAGIHAAVV